MKEFLFRFFFFFSRPSDAALSRASFYMLWYVQRAKETNFDCEKFSRIFFALFALLAESRRAHLCVCWEKKMNRPPLPPPSKKKSERKKKSYNIFPRHSLPQLRRSHSVFHHHSSPWPRLHRPRARLLFSLRKGDGFLYKKKVPLLVTSAQTFIPRSFLCQTGCVPSVLWRCASPYSPPRFQSVSVNPRPPQTPLYHTGFAWLALTNSCAAALLSRRASPYYRLFSSNLYSSSSVFGTSGLLPLLLAGLFFLLLLFFLQCTYYYTPFWRVQAGGTIHVYVELLSPSAITALHLFRH